MKKPSIDAIRRFKEQQKRKKLEETERKIQEKLSTLEHRAARGDRKAKTELKIIEKAKEERIRRPEVHEKHNHGDKRLKDPRKHDNNNSRSTNKRPMQAETDFDELMRLAANNNNQLRREEVKRPSSPLLRTPSIAKKCRDATSPPTRPSSKQPLPTQSSSRTTVRLLPSSQQLQIRQGSMKPLPPRPISESNARNYQIRADYYDEDDEDDYEDDYEQDGFVVDEDDAEVRDEVSKTIKSVFGYDKRRCDLREAELDRQYRQIGRVSTFEDLEREERRASRLAAVEDARAAREEEERKRLKRLRMKGH